MQQCRAKIKELRQVYHKMREANHRSGGACKTCCFYKELNAILVGDPISITDCPVDTSHAAERGSNPEAEIVNEDDVVLPVGLPGGPGSQELFSTPEVLSGEREADETPAQTLNTSRTPVDWLRQIRKKPRLSKEHVFREVLQRDDRQTREQKGCWEAERQDRKESAAFAREVTERMIKVMADQTEMLKSLIQLQTEQIRVGAPLQQMHNSFPPPSTPTHSFSLHSTPEFPHHSTPSELAQ
ncbi:uncharacterized protein LOC135982682 [Chrysemys picta bellii]|uniref:uncharacterized protein LOC135982682 n=1 Tax=Chrysemys picta bellii TaxID=8478 RepID=UPI0032B2CFD2